MLLAFAAIVFVSLLVSNGSPAKAAALSSTYPDGSTSGSNVYATVGTNAGGAFQLWNGSGGLLHPPDQPGGATATRSESALGDSDFTVIVPSSMLSTQLTITIVDGCKALSDPNGNGWEDHTYYSPTSGNPFNGIVLKINSVAQVASCSSQGDMVASINNYLTPNSRFGTNMYSLVASVVDGTTNNSEKVFHVRVTGGAYVGPTDAASDTGISSFTNLQNPEADYYDTVAGPCNNGANTANCPVASGVGGLSSANVPGNTADPIGSTYNTDGSPKSTYNKNDHNTYNFYFSPDCNYAGQHITLNWRLGAGIDATDPDNFEGGPQEQWVLYDNGQPTGYSATNSQLNSGSMALTNLTLKIGDSYDWQWTNVDRAHGVSVQMPYSGYTVSQANCGWKLTGKSTVTPPSLPNNTNSATFSHTITNGPNSAPASYTWIIEGQYRGANGNVSAWSQTGCTINAGVVRAGYKCPMGGGTVSNSGPNGTGPLNWVIKYEFPPGAANNDEYCQRIWYTNANGSGTAAEGSNGGTGNGVCVTYSPGGPPPTGGSISGCFGTDVSVPATFTGSFGGSDVGTYKARSIFAASGGYGNPVVARAGPNPYAGSVAGNYVVANGPANPQYTYYPDSTSIGTWIIFQAYAKFTTYYYAGNDKSGKAIYLPETSYQWENVSSSMVNYPCYSATCQVLSVNYPPGQDFVAAGQNYSETVLFTNTGPYYMFEQAFYNWGPSLGLIGGNGGSYSTSYPLGTSLGWPPSSATVDVTMTAGPGPQYEQPEFKPAYMGAYGFDLGTTCSNSPPIDVYEPFSITGSATASLAPDDEDPTSLTYSTQVCNTETNAPVDVASDSSVYEVPAGGGYVPIANYPSPPPYLGCANHSGTVPLPPDPNRQAGDKYCAVATYDHTYGWVGAGGPDDLKGLSPGGGQNGPTCDHVINEPYFKVYGSGISAGGDFSPNCSGGGYLEGWNNDSGMYPSDIGASAQFNTLALSSIIGVASAQRNNPGRSTTDLSFANTGVSVAHGDAHSPVLGGSFGGAQCFPDVSPPKSGGDTSSPGGNTPIGPMTIPVGDDKSIFVNGDAYIAGNIVYAGSTDKSWKIGATSSSVPSFVLHASGDIYIDRNVTELDGTYISDKSGGGIYTCSDSIDGSDYAKMPAADLYTYCNNQLVVHGEFEADNVALMRTFGSLRNEKPPVSGTCSNWSGVAADWSDRDTCAAEVFDFTPEQYLAPAAVEPPNNGTTEYQAVTSLPPIL